MVRKYGAISIIRILIPLVLATGIGGCTGQRESEELILLFETKFKNSVNEIEDPYLYPRSTQIDGTWNLVQSDDWTSGFFAGCLWYMYTLTDDVSFKEAAVKWTESLEKEKVNTRTHDLGFMVFTSYGNGFKTMPNEKYRRVLLEAARSLASRYDPGIGVIKSWDWSREWQYPVIIDNLVNLELLFWAAENSGNADWYEIAHSHALRTVQDHIRDNGSTFHVVNYDSTTGEVISKVTHQGYADASTWARGQAWALYGLTVAYEYSGDNRFYDAIQSVLDYYLTHVPDDLIPFWDYNIEEEQMKEKDVSAAAITAAALFRLSKSAGNDDAQKYRGIAQTVLNSLLSSPYLNTSTGNGIIKPAVGNYPQNKEVGVSLIYADYYFLEAFLYAQRNGN